MIIVLASFYHKTIYSNNIPLQKKDSAMEEDLDKRISRIKQKNKAIMLRSQEVEEDKHLYG